MDRGLCVWRKVQRESANQELALRPLLVSVRCAFEAMSHHARLHTASSNEVKTDVFTANSTTAERLYRVKGGSKCINPPPNHGGGADKIPPPGWW